MQIEAVRPRFVFNTKGTIFLNISIDILPVYTEFGLLNNLFTFYICGNQFFSSLILTVFTNLIVQLVIGNSILPNQPMKNNNSVYYKFTT